MSFKPGDKVICINSSIQPHMLEEVSKDIPNWVKKDEEYTIREVLSNDNIVTGILLEEVVNKPIYFSLIKRVQEPAFGAFRFRKLQYSSEVNKEVESLIKDLVQ